jgi:hypothetical protein
MGIKSSFLHTPHKGQCENTVTQEQVAWLFCTLNKEIPQIDRNLSLKSSFAHRKDFSFSITKKAKTKVVLLSAAIFQNRPSCSSPHPLLTGHCHQGLRPGFSL